MKFKLPKLPKIEFSKPVMMWLLGVLTVSVGAQVALYFGFLQKIYFADVTHLSIVIFAIFLWQSLMCGGSLYSATAYGYDKSLDRKLERGWFYSDVVLSIGMIGTVIGFTIMLAGFSDINFENSDEIQSLIAKLGYGMSTALSTTLVGLVSSVVLKLQFFLLETHIEDEKNSFLP